MIQELSVGGIVFYEFPEKGRKYLLLEYGKGHHWAIPKGHQENQESYQQTAIREIKEETGLSKENLQILKQLDHSFDYWFYRNNDKVHKTVHVFLIKSNTFQVKISYEHSDYGWYSFSEVEKKLTYNSSWPAFKEAERLLSKQKNRNSKKK